MAIIITYDVPSKHMELKEALLNKGYQDQIPGKTCKTIYFPNTTLYHSSKSASAAREEVKAECKTLNITLDRCVATKWDDWSAICGEAFK